MGIIGTYNYNMKQTAPDTTSLTILSPKVERGQIVEVTGATVGDYTTKNKKLVLGVRDYAGKDTYLKVTQESSTFSHDINGLWFMIEGDQFFGIIESPTASDVCYFSVHGRRYKTLV